jgi:hypothetical protein
LRSHGLRKKVAKSLAALDGNGRRAGAKGEQMAKETADHLSAAAEEIHKRILRRDRKRSQAARQAAGTRKRKSAQRRASARRGAQTRAKVAKTRTRAKRQSRS